MNLRYLEGKKVCLVFVRQSEREGQVQCRFLFGRANVSNDQKLMIEHENGTFLVPSSCYNQIFPNEGDEPRLKDAEYYILCHVSGMKL